MPSKLIVKDTRTNHTFDYQLTRDETRIGRAGDRSDLVLDDGQVSRVHALVRRTGSGYTLVDFTARYRYKAVEAFLSVENVLDAAYREAQFFFTSRLRGEPAEGVADIHFTPGNPRTILGGLAVHF